MTCYLLDTGIAADYLNRRPVYARAREAATAGNCIGLCAPVLGKLWDAVFYNLPSGFCGLCVLLWPFS